jgi:hypothetical protein
VSAGCQLLLEREYVDAHQAERQPDLLVAAGLEYTVTECSPQVVKGLTQCAARVVRVELRPEDRQQRIATLEPGRRQRQVGEERSGLGLDVDPLARLARVADLESAEETKADRNEALRPT